MALERLGADIEYDGGYVVAKAKNGLKGGEIRFPKVTVGGTHTALMAAVLANEFSEATDDVYLAALVQIGFVLFVITLVVNGLARLLIASVATPKVARA